MKTLHYKRTELHKSTCLLIAGSILCGDAVVAIPQNTQSAVLAVSQVRQGTLVEVDESEYIKYTDLLAIRTKIADDKKNKTSTKKIVSSKVEDGEEVNDVKDVKTDK